MTLRVLVACPGMHPREGGPPRVVYGSVVALTKKGVTVEIVTTGLPDEDFETWTAWPELAELVVKMHIFPRRGFKRLGRSPALRRFVLANVDQFDLLHVHCVWEAAPADAAAVFRAAGKATLVSPHGMLDRWQMSQSTLKKRAALLFLGTGKMLKGADALLYGTMDEAQEAAQMKLPGAVVTMPNGVSPISVGSLAGARRAILKRFPELRGWGRTVFSLAACIPKRVTATLSSSDKLATTQILYRPGTIMDARIPRRRPVAMFGLNDIEI